VDHQVQAGQDSGDNFQLDASVVRPDPQEPFTPIGRGGRSGVIGVDDASGVGSADAMLSARLGPGQLHTPPL